MRILITGGLGFIGNALTTKLQELGHDIIVLDQFIRDYEDYVRADVTEFADLWKRLRHLQRIDIVIHMAGEVGRILGEEHPHKTLNVNCIGTLNIIELCLEFGAKLVYFSTSEVYGKDFDNDTVAEEKLTKISGFDLTNIYALSKYFGETLVHHYVTNYGLKAVAIRPFTVYGPGVISSKYKSAIDQFIFNALTGHEFYVHKGTERSWCYIDDFVDAMILVLENHTFKEGIYEAYNIGTQDYRSMEDVAELVLTMTGAPRSLMKIVEPPSKFLVRKKRFSTEKIEALGFSPKITLEEGIRKTIQWHKSVLDHTNNDVGGLVRYAQYI